jgi:Helix-turn-helix domain
MDEPPPIDTDPRELARLLTVPPEVDGASPVQLLGRIERAGQCIAGTLDLLPNSRARTSARRLLKGCLTAAARSVGIPREPPTRCVEAALMHLVENGTSVSAAARAAGVPVSTVRYWLRRRDVRERLEALRQLARNP